MSALRQRMATSIAGRTAGHGLKLRFLLAGGINTTFGLLIYPILLWSFDWLHRHYMIGLLLAQAIGLTFAFVNYKRTVFRTRGRLVREFATFSSFYLVNYAVNWAALPLLVEVAHIQPIVAQLAFAVVLAIGSWFWHSRVTFRDARDT